MNREEYVETLVKEFVKIRKIDKGNDYSLKLYDYEGEFILTINNGYIGINPRLWIYVKPYDDTDEELTESYNKFMDFVESRYEKIFEGEKNA